MEDFSGRFVGIFTPLAAFDRWTLTMFLMCTLLPEDDSLALGSRELTLVRFGEAARELALEI